MGPSVAGFLMFPVDTLTTATHMRAVDRISIDTPGWTKRYGSTYVENQDGRWCEMAEQSLILSGTHLNHLPMTFMIS